MLVLLAGFAIYFFYYVPTYEVVRVNYGGWAVDGAAPSYPPAVGCGDCGKVVPVGTQFTVHLNFQPQGGSCASFFGCPGYYVDSISVDAPYTLVSTSPAYYGQYVGPGQFYTWALVIQAPSSPGTHAVGGIIAVH